MGDIKFNVSKDMVGYYAGLPATSDALVAVVLEASGLQSDDILSDHDTLAALLAATNNEQTTMGRKTLSSVAVNRVGTGTAAIKNISAADIAWTAATGNATAAIVICYVPDTGTSTDTDLIPLSKHDFVTTPSGGNLSQALVGGFLNVV